MWCHPWPHAFTKHGRSRALPHGPVKSIVHGWVRYVQHSQTIFSTTKLNCLPLQKPRHYLQNNPCGAIKGTLDIINIRYRSVRPVFFEECSPHMNLPHIQNVRTSLLTTIRPSVYSNDCVIFELSFRSICDHFRGEPSIIRKEWNTNIRLVQAPIASEHYVKGIP